MLSDNLFEGGGLIVRLGDLFRDCGVQGDDERGGGWFGRTTFEWFWW